MLYPRHWQVWTVVREALPGECLLRKKDWGEECHFSLVAIPSKQQDPWCLGAIAWPMKIGNLEALV